MKPIVYPWVSTFHHLAYHFHALSKLLPKRVIFVATDISCIAKAFVSPTLRSKFEQINRLTK